MYESTDNTNQVGKSMPTRSASIMDYISRMDAGKAEITDRVSKSQQAERENTVLSLHEHGVSATDEPIKTQYSKASKLEEAAGLISAFNGATGDYQTIIKNFINENDKDGSMYNAFMDFKNGKITTGELASLTVDKASSPTPTFQLETNSYSPNIDTGMTYDPGEHVDYRSPVGRGVPSGVRTAAKLGLWEGIGAAGESIGKAMYNSNLRRSNLDRTQNISYNRKDWQLDQWEKELNNLNIELNDGIENGESEERIQKKKAQIYDAEKEIERLSAAEKPVESKEILKKYGITGTEEEIAGKAGGQSKFLYKAKVEPLIKDVKDTVNIAEFWENLSASDFSKELRTQKKYKDLIDEYLMEYKNATEVPLSEVRDIYNGLPDLSSDAVKGDIPLQIEKRINDTFKTFLQNQTKEKLKSTYPDKADYIDELFSDMSKLMAQEEAAVKGVPLNPKKFKLSDLVSKKNLLKILDKMSTKTRTKVGKGIANVFHVIRPSTLIKGAINYIVKGGTNIARGLSKTTKTTGGDFNDVVIAGILEEAGLEPAMFPIAEMAAYATEMSKLNKENGTDLPLYDSENSYINQNPNAGGSPFDSIIPDSMKKDYEAQKSMEEQDRYKQLLKMEEESGKKYADEISEIDIEELLNSIE